MILAIDVGNTTMEFGIFEKDALKANFRLNTNHEMTSDEIGLLTSQFFTAQNIALSKIDDIIISTVVPQIMYSVTAACKKYFGKMPIIAGKDISINIPNFYDNPKEVGTDRLVTSYAAIKLYGPPFIIIDFGTATTFDTVSKNGEYLGGVIFPGIKLSLLSLVKNTAKLPIVELLVPEKAIGTNTIGSMQSGIVHGYAGAVKNIIEMLKNELAAKDEKVKTIATGGLSQIIQDTSPGIFDEINKTLTLQGLNILYRN